MRTSTCAGIAARSASDTPPQRRLEQHVDARRGCRFGQSRQQIDRLVQPKPAFLPEDQIKIA